MYGSPPMTVKALREKLESLENEGYGNTRVVVSVDGEEVLMHPGSIHILYQACPPNGFLRGCYRGHPDEGEPVVVIE
jgi:hypothetical protein